MASASIVLSSEVEHDVDQAPDDSELDALRALAALLDRPPTHRGARPVPQFPFERPEPLDPATRRAVEAAALEANERYLRSFVEAHSFCPYSRSGRAKGLTARFVHGLDGEDAEALLGRMEELAKDTSKVVAQIILPLAEVGPHEWTRFCHELTAAGNDRLRTSAGGGADVYAVAPLHPTLPYDTANPYTLIPLLRRAPDPTIQWVRLDALADLYRGREGDTVYVDPEQLGSSSTWTSRKKTPLFDRIAETNRQMALRLGFARVEAELTEIAQGARERSLRALLGQTAPTGCPHTHEPSSERAAPAPRTARRRGERWTLCRQRELPPATPVAFRAGGVDLVVVRAHGATHVLHGRCPHRHALLSEAIVESERLVCPHHGWDFRLEDGRSEGVAGASVARFTTLEHEGHVEVDAAELDAYVRANPPTFDEDDEIL